MSSALLPNILEALCRGETVPMSEIQSIASDLLHDAYDEYQITALLIALKTQTLTSDYLFEFVKVIRSLDPAPFQNTDLSLPIGDCCGTGGDGIGTYNISTAVALVAASHQVTIAKHGNRSSASQCGAADILEAFEYPLEQSPQSALHSLKQHHFSFLFAPHYYPSFQKFRSIRQSLKVKTIFNLLGPLLNPFPLSFQLLGVYDPNMCLPIAETLLKQGVKRALVIHGAGLDELALHGPSNGFLLNNNKLSSFTLTPEAVGLPYHPLASLKGGDAKYNAQALLDVFSGEGNPAYLDAILLNSGALFYLADQVDSIAEGVCLARELIQRKQVLDHFFNILQG